MRPSVSPVSTSAARNGPRGLVSAEIAMSLRICSRSVAGALPGAANASSTIVNGNSALIVSVAPLAGLGSYCLRGGSFCDGIGPNHLRAEANTSAGFTSPVTTSVALLG